MNWVERKLAFDAKLPQAWMRLRTELEEAIKTFGKEFAWKKNSYVETYPKNGCIESNTNITTHPWQEDR